MMSYAKKYLTQAFDKVAHRVAQTQDLATHHGQRIAAAFSASSPLEHKGFHAVKFAGLASLCAFGLLTLNPGEAVAGGIAIADEIVQLEKVGAHVLSDAPKPKI